MKGKQLAVLLLVVLLLGGLWHWTGGLRTGVWSDKGNAGGKVVEFPLNDVAQIVLTGASGDLHLVKKSDGWAVQERADYPANFEQVSGLLRKLWDLKRVQVVKVGPSQLSRLDLADPRKGSKTGTLVQLLGADGKPLDALILGKKYLRKGAGGDMGLGDMGADGFPAGRYVKRADGETVALITEMLDEADPKAERWLAKDFVKITGAKTITVTGPTDAQRWSISRDAATSPWKLDGAKPDETLDATKVSGFDGTLSALSFNDVLAPDAKLGDPVTTVEVSTFDGFKYELKAGPTQAENDPLLLTVTADLPKERTPGKDEKPEDKTRLDAEFLEKQKQLVEKLTKEKRTEGRLYLVAKATVESLVKDRAALLEVKPVPPAPTPAPPTPAAAPVPSPTPVPAPTPEATPTPSTPVTVTTPPLSAPTPSAPPVVQNPVPAASATPSPEGNSDPHSVAPTPVP